MVLRFAKILTYTVALEPEPTARGQNVSPSFQMNKRDKRRCKCCAACIGFLVIFGIVFFGFFCPDHVCALTEGNPIPQYKNRLEAYLQGKIIHENFDKDDIERDYDFDLEGEDVLVFLHMQKTGGSTFGRHLVKNLHLPTAPCHCVRGRKRCDCKNSSKHLWLFSRFSVGWPCGLHADWTELHSCVPEEMNRKEKHERRRRYFRYLYITILRDPLERYLSEWKHVQRGATWKAATLKCNGREATLDEVPFCFEGTNWRGVSLSEFMSCDANLANNRMTRMLANLSLVGCYNHSAMPPDQRNKVLIESAKENLKSMAYFGLTEFQRDTQYLFERTFSLTFNKLFEQWENTRARAINLTEKERQAVIKRNELDIELYQFAKDLFFQRLQKWRTEEGLAGNVTVAVKKQPDSDSSQQLPQNHVKSKENDDEDFDDKT